MQNSICSRPSSFYQRDHRGRWIYNYLWNQCLSPLMLWVRISLITRCTDRTLCDKGWQWLATGRWFFLGPPVSSTNTIDCHDITEILLKVALNTITSNHLSAMHFPTMFLPNLLICHEYCITKIGQLLHRIKILSMSYSFSYWKIVNYVIIEVMSHKLMQL